MIEKILQQLEKNRSKNNEKLKKNFFLSLEKCTLAKKKINKNLGIHISHLYRVRLGWVRLCWVSG